MILYIENLKHTHTHTHTLLLELVNSEKLQDIRPTHKSVAFPSTTNEQY